MWMDHDVFQPSSVCFSLLRWACFRVVIFLFLVCNDDISLDTIVLSVSSDDAYVTVIEFRFINYTLENKI